MPELRDCCLVSGAVKSPAMEFYMGSDSFQFTDSNSRRIVQGPKISTEIRYATMKFCELKTNSVSRISCSSALELRSVVICCSSNSLSSSHCLRGDSFVTCLWVHFGAAFDPIFVGQ